MFLGFFLEGVVIKEYIKGLIYIFGYCIDNGYLFLVFWDSFKFIVSLFSFVVRWCVLIFCLVKEGRYFVF